MGRKILVGGSFSVGKTSLANQLVCAIPGASILPDHARELKSLFPQIAWDCQAVRDYMLVSQVIREAAAISADRTVICDSGILIAKYSRT
jgi:hypothetical protein